MLFFFVALCSCASPDHWRSLIRLLAPLKERPVVYQPVTGLSWITIWGFGPEHLYLGQSSNFQHLPPVFLWVAGLSIFFIGSVGQTIFPLDFGSDPGATVSRAIWVFPDSLLGFNPGEGALAVDNHRLLCTSKLKWIAKISILTPT